MQKHRQQQCMEPLCSLYDGSHCDILLKAQGPPCRVIRPSGTVYDDAMLISLIPPHTTRDCGASARSLQPAAKEATKPVD